MGTLNNPLKGIERALIPQMFRVWGLEKFAWNMPRPACKSEKVPRRGSVARV